MGLNERLRFLRYDPGQYFLQHPDGHFSRGRRERSFITLLLYLNEGYVGGHTTIWNRVGGQSSRPEDGIPVPPRVDSTDGGSLTAAPDGGAREPSG